MNFGLKRIFTYQSFVSRRLFGAFEMLGKRQRYHKVKSEHRDRMRNLKRIKKINQLYASRAEKEPSIEFLTPTK
ncbi:MAG: hypothetical protein GW827_12595 [Flavobacteriales bacterium]|nr:hypothetical protein [Flavobacteriales bacterium]